MAEAKARALRPSDARRAEAILRRLGARWDAPALANLTVGVNARLRRTLGRLVGRPLRIELGPRALLGGDKRLQEIVTHEAAHAALATGDGATPQAPHGPGWRRLMALAGYPGARAAHWRCREADSQRASPGRPTTPKAPSTRYDHWCPVCQTSRVGRRPVKAWRCAACVAAGLDGKLEITRRSTTPATAR